MVRAADDAIIASFVRCLRAAGYGVSDLVWYGSRAHGDGDAGSDFDLIVVAPEFGVQPWVRRLVAAYACWPAAHAADLLCYAPQEFRFLAARAGIVREAVQTGRRIEYGENEPSTGESYGLMR